MCKLLPVNTLFVSTLVALVLFTCHCAKEGPAHPSDLSLIPYHDVVFPDALETYKNRKEYKNTREYQGNSGYGAVNVKEDGGTYKRYNYNIEENEVSYCYF